MPTKTAATNSWKSSPPPNIRQSSVTRKAQPQSVMRDRAPERDHEDRHGAPDLAGLDFAHRGGHRRGRGDDRPDVELGRDRLDDEQRAGKADADRGPAPPAHHFAVEHDRERGDDQRRDLQHGRDVGEVHVRQRRDEARGREPIAKRARGQHPAHRRSQCLGRCRTPARPRRSAASTSRRGRRSSRRPDRSAEAASPARR